MRLSKTAYKWSIQHLVEDGDTDLFPIPLELHALKYHRDHGLLDDLAAIDLSTFKWRSGRRLLVPKDPLSFRSATQLYPLDSILLAALTKTIGSTLERHRVPPDAQKVFSYRFSPNTRGRMYGSNTGWTDFWERSRANALGFGYVLVADITDFYNQIYHHVLENQLRDAGLTQVAQRVLKRFFQAQTGKVSRGLPIGPHAIHLFAELTLHPLDESIMAQGYLHCRYVDDIHIFCATIEDAHAALYDLAETLDSQQKLCLARAKTRIVRASDFVKEVDEMLTDRPINQLEADVIAAIAHDVGDDPYAQVPDAQLSSQTQTLLSAANLEAILQAYFAQNPTNYTRIAWLFRRLRQVRTPAAIDFVSQHLDKLVPVLGDVARYLMSAVPSYQGDPQAVGDRLLRHLQSPTLARSRYLQMVVFDTLAQIPALNHAMQATAKYNDCSLEVRREILRVAAAHGLGSWLRSKRLEFEQFDPWSRPAFLAGLPAFPGDEATHLLSTLKANLTPMERLVVQWAFRDRTLKLGDTKVTG